MKNKKTLTILLIVMVLVVAFVPTIVLAEPHSGIYTGYITLTSNAEPAINSFDITYSSAPVSTFTPTLTYDISFEVSDLDGMDDIEQIMLVFWWDDTGVTPTDLPTIPGDNDSSIFNAIEVKNSIGDFVTDSTLTTWSATTPTNYVDNPTSFTYSFTVNVGKSARQVLSLGGSDRWMIGLKVDDGNATDFLLYDHGTGTDLGMTWYGEMSASEYAGPQWSSGTPGMDFDTLTGTQVFDETYPLTVISNGAYNLKTKVAQSWTNTDPATITYDHNLVSDDSFAVAVDTTDSYNVGVSQILQYTAGADTDEVVIPTSTWGDRTDFDGILITDIYMFLKTNANIVTSSNAFTGNVTVEIENDLG